jgi:protein disulfide-isomerase A1
MIHKLAEDHRNAVMFVVVDTDEDDHRRVIEFLGLKDEKMPTMRIIQMKEDIIKYKPESTDIEEENINKFVKDYVDGKVPIHYLTEKLPEDWDSKPVKVQFCTD